MIRRAFNSPCAWGLFSVSILTLLIGVSCGSGPEPVYPLRGKVLVNGKPASQATVMFHPVGGSEQLQKLRPYARCDDSGAFVVGTHNPGDGIPPGAYKVTIVWPAPPKKMSDDDEHTSDGDDQLQGKYAHDAPKDSPLQVTVTASQSELPPFDLK